MKQPIIMLAPGTTVVMKRHDGPQVHRWYEPPDPRVHVTLEEATSDSVFVPVVESPQPLLWALVPRKLAEEAVRDGAAKYTRSEWDSCPAMQQWRW
jgi:hypothetical protein